MVNNQEKRGFTIIEVVLVLAIAGLIFLMVFIALPALQRSQRNNQRQNDINRFFTAFQQYQAHNSNKLPFRYENNTYTIDPHFVSRYIDSSCKSLEKIAPGGITKDEPTGGLYKTSECTDQFTDPDGTIYYIAYNAGANSSAYSNGTVRSINEWDFDHVIHFSTNTVCGENEGELKYSSGKNDYSIIMNLEGGSYYCRDSKK